MVSVSSSLTKKRLKPTKNYKTLELIALEIKTDASSKGPERSDCSDRCDRRESSANSSENYIYIHIHTDEGVRPVA